MVNSTTSNLKWKKIALLSIFKLKENLLCTYQELNSTKSACKYFEHYNNLTIFLTQYICYLNRKKNSYICTFIVASMSTSMYDEAKCQNENNHLGSKDKKSSVAKANNIHQYSTKTRSNESSQCKSGRPQSRHKGIGVKVIRKPCN